MTFAAAIESALAQAMAADERIIIWGEDVQAMRMNLTTRFGEGRIKQAPISEGAFVAAGVSAAMAGLRPVVEVMLVDFISVAMDAVMNQAAMVAAFTGGRWQVPLVVRASCGGGYGDAGQHEQSLWGLLAHIPGLSVMVPSTPADAGGLMLAALEHPEPSIFLEHKLLADYWLDVMAGSWRKNVLFDIPDEGSSGPVPDKWEPTPFGKAATRRAGDDLSIISVGVGVHRALEAAETLAA
ncbi:MAG: pyruvate dehydrogenase, partial [Candidatus Neomarinimicrobiota bacterium]